MTTAASRPQQRTHRRAETVRTHRQSYLSSQPQWLRGVQTAESHSWPSHFSRLGATLVSLCHSLVSSVLLPRRTPTGRYRSRAGRRHAVRHGSRTTQVERSTGFSCSGIAPRASERASGRAGGRSGRNRAG